MSKTKACFSHNQTQLASDFLVLHLRYRFLEVPCNGRAETVQRVSPTDIYGHGCGRKQVKAECAIYKVVPLWHRHSTNQGPEGQARAGQPHRGPFESAGWALECGQTDQTSGFCPASAAPFSSPFAHLKIRKLRLIENLKRSSLSRELVSLWRFPSAALDDGLAPPTPAPHKPKAVAPRN